MQTDPKELWKRYIAGDKSVFGELYLYYHKELTFFCLGKTRSFALAEDAASNTLLKLLEEPNPKKISNFKSWLFTVARNACYSDFSKNKRHRDANESIKHSQIKEVNNKGEQALVEADIRKMMTEILTLKEKDVWELHEQGYNNQEISDRLGIMPKTVANIKNIVRNKFRGKTRGGSAIILFIYIYALCLFFID